MIFANSSLSSRLWDCLLLVIKDWQTCFHRHIGEPSLAGYFNFCTHPFWDAWWMVVVNDLHSFHFVLVLFVCVFRNRILFYCSFVGWLPWKQLFLLLTSRSWVNVWSQWQTCIFFNMGIISLFNQGFSRVTHFLDSIIDFIGGFGVEPKAVCTLGTSSVSRLHSCFPFSFLFWDKVS